MCSFPTNRELEPAPLVARNWHVRILGQYMGEKQGWKRKEEKTMQFIGAITFLLQLKGSTCTSLELISRGKLNFSVWAYFNQNNWAGISMNQCWLTFSNWCLSLLNFSSWILESFAHQGAIPMILYFKYFKYCIYWPNSCWSISCGNTALLGREGTYTVTVLCQPF